MGDKGYCVELHEKLYKYRRLSGNVQLFPINASDENDFLYADKNVLAAGCQYFQDLFYPEINGGPEVDEDDPMIPISQHPPGQTTSKVGLPIDRAVLEIILKGIYLDQYAISLDNWKLLMEASKLLKLDKLTQKCFDFLKDQKVTKDVWLLPFRLAHEYAKNEEMLQKVYEFLKKYSTDIYDTPEFVHLKFEELKMLVDAGVWTDPTHLQIAKFKWFAHETQLRTCHTVELVKLDLPKVDSTSNPQDKSNEDLPKDLPINNPVQPTNPATDGQGQGQGPSHLQHLPRPSTSSASQLPDLASKTLYKSTISDGKNDLPTGSPSGVSGDELNTPIGSANPEEFAINQLDPQDKTNSVSLELEVGPPNQEHVVEPISQSAPERDQSGESISQTGSNLRQVKKRIFLPSASTRPKRTKTAQKIEHSEGQIPCKVSKKRHSGRNAKAPPRKKSKLSKFKNARVTILPEPTTYREAEAFFITRTKAKHIVYKNDWDANVKQLKGLKSELNPNICLYPGISDNIIKLGILFHLGSTPLPEWHSEQFHSSASYVALELLRGRTKLFLRSANDAEQFVLRLIRFFSSPQASDEKIQHLKSGHKKAEIHWMDVLGQDKGFKSYDTRKEFVAVIVSALDYDGGQNARNEISQGEKDKILLERTEMRKEAAKKTKYGAKKTKGEARKPIKKVDETTTKVTLRGMNGGRTSGSGYKNLYCCMNAILEGVFALKGKPYPFRTGPTYDEWKERNKFVPEKFQVPAEFISTYQDATEDKMWMRSMEWSSQNWKQFFSTHGAGLDTGESESKAFNMARRFKKALDEGKHEYFTRRNVIAAALGFGYADFSDLD